MKQLLRGCALTVLALSLASHAGAQALRDQALKEVDVKPAPIHAVPTDADGTQGALIGGQAPVQLAQAAPQSSVQAEMQAKMQAQIDAQAAAQAAAAPPPEHTLQEQMKALAKADAAQTQAPAATLVEAKAPTAAEQRANFAVASLTQPPPAPPEPELSPQETQFFTALGRRVTDAAAAYEDYVRGVAAIDARFTRAEQVQSALTVAERYNAVQLQEGAVAYAAVLALRSEAFVNGVRRNANPGMVDQLIAEPEAVLSIPGSGEAVLDVSSVLRVQAHAVFDNGGAIAKAAYSVQRQSWSKGAVAEPDQVLAYAKSSALKIAAADVRAERRLLESIGAAPQNLEGRPTPSPEVTRGLALAAVAILGQAGDAQEGRFEPLLRVLRNADCLQLAKMDLNQCLAVAGPQYEDVFCLGAHAVGETGKCLVSATGDSPADNMPLRTASIDADASERAEAYGR